MFATDAAAATDVATVYVYRFIVSASTSMFYVQRSIVFRR